MKDYISKFGLEFNPFIKNSKDILVSTSEYKEAIIRLDYLARTRGFGLVTGSAGKGKTTAVRNWAQSLNTSLYRVIYTCLSTLTVQEFYRSLACGMGVVPAFRKTDNFRIIQDEITRLSVEKKKTPVIIIDEANYVNNAILNDLKMLFNFEMDSRDRAVVLLVGLPQLNATLNLSSHEPLRQRLVMNYNLDGISKEEAREYISSKIAGAGGDVSIFDDNAMEAIINGSDGTPRLINKLCNKSMMIAALSGQKTVTSESVMNAINECELS